ncbi:hypothetical protein O181_019880 [Austropuccinia psidii MF-1]|uniref:Uncharacterized protein n=1 Tax=Austropuccinia psidii MF-1 TaxID=1389203 RepID=A0A9Q3CCQ3_9BASI|nr:hypothetical protein [Austropuccinia psidii MF-1]
MRDKHRERVADVTKKKHCCKNCVSEDHYANNFPKAKTKVYAIEQIPNEESPTHDTKSDSMGDSIRENSDDYQDPKKEFLVEYQKEPQLEMQDVQLEAGMPQDTAKQNLCGHTLHAQTFLVTTNRGILCIHGTSTKINVCIYNAQQLLIIESGAHLSIVAREYLDNHFPSWEKKLLPTMAKSFKIASGTMTSSGSINKEIIIPHRKGNIRLKLKFLVLEDSHIQGLLLGTYYHRMYGMDIYNSKNRHITIGINEENK